MSLPIKTSFSYYDLFTTYLRPQWQRAITMTILILTSIGLQLLNPQLLRNFIDQALNNTANNNSLLFTGTLFVGIALLQQAASVAATYVSENVAWTATNQLRTDLVTHCLRLDMAFHKSKTSGELIERIDGDVNKLSKFFSQAVVQLFGNLLLMIGILALLFREDWRVGIAMSLFMVCALIAIISVRNFAVPYWTKDREHSAEYYGFLSEQLIGTEDIRANGATGYVLQRFHRLLRKWYPVSRRATLAGYSIWITIVLTFGIGNAIALTMGAYLWSIHAISEGTVYLIFYYTNLLVTPIEQIRSILQQLQEAGAGIARIKQLLQTTPTIQDGSGPDLPKGALSVAFKNVTFGYNEQEPIIHNLSFTLQAGRILGILGRTGSGKTTLARLLLRLYDIQTGEISLGGIELKQARLQNLRQRIGMVTQDVQLFHATVRDNLTFFNRTIGDERILAVIEDIGLLPWYKSLSDGLDTLLGSDGEGLSAGEAQLLAFTRVFLSDPGLIILDEASSRLDPATEQLIERAVHKLLQNRTAIVIAHRLTTIQRADEIMVLGDGRILEHDQQEALSVDDRSRFYQLLQTGLEEVRA